MNWENKYHLSVWLPGKKHPLSELNFPTFFNSPMAFFFSKDYNLKPNFSRVNMGAVAACWPKLNPTPGKSTYEGGKLRGSRALPSKALTAKGLSLLHIYICLMNEKRRKFIKNKEACCEFFFSSLTSLL